MNGEIYYPRVTHQVGGNTDGVTANISTGTYILAGGNNITLSQDANTVSIVGGAGGAGITAGLSNIGNTSGDTGAVTGRLIFAGGNNITLSGSTNGGSMTITVSAPNLGAGAGYTAGMSDIGNTSGTTGLVQSQLVFAGGNNVTLSQSVNGQSATLTMSVPATSSLSATGIVSISTNGATISIGAGRTISNLVLVPNGGAGGPIPFAQSSISLGQNSLYVYPVQIKDYLSIDNIRMPVLVTNSSSAVSSGQKALTFQMGIYTRNNTNNTVITRHYSTSYTIQASYSSNVSWAQSMITAIGNSTSYNTLTASSAGLNLSASLHGAREMIMPVSSVLSPGEYWFAILQSSAGSGTVGNVLNVSNLAVAHQTYNRPGLSTASSNSGFFQQVGMGLYSATTGALPAGISQTQLNLMGTQPIMFAGTGTV